MRKVTQLTTNAFFRGQNLSLSNTVVKQTKEFAEMYLHWNLIAVLDKAKNILLLSDCGRQSNTTKERLNGLLWGMSEWITQKNWTWYIWDSNADTYKDWKNKDWNEFKIA